MKHNHHNLIQLVEPMVLQTEIMCSVECLLLDDCTAFTFEVKARTVPGVSAKFSGLSQAFESLRLRIN